jgi:hypothetical protein
MRRFDGNDIAAGRLANRRLAKRSPGQ